MVRIIQFTVALVAMALTANAEIWCQCKYASGAHCCVANAASGLYTCESLCDHYPNCDGVAEGISWITYQGRSACVSLQGRKEGTPFQA